MTDILMKRTGAQVLISTTTFAEFDTTPLELIKAKGMACVLNPYGRTLKTDEVVSLGRDVVGIIAGTERLDEEVFAALGRLVVISRCGAGMDGVDTEAARRRGVKIYSTPDAPTVAVAELTVAVILDLMRKVTAMDRKMRGGTWEKQMGSLLSGKRVGIVGFGRIGRKTAELLRALGCEIWYTDPAVTEAPPGTRRVPFDELIKGADIISLHVSAKKTLIGAAELAMMKPGSWIVNLSRGGVVDEGALYTALIDGRIAGAALDVFTEEPYRGGLATLENVVLTPHVGSYAKEARIAMERESVENLLKGLEVIP